MLPVIEETGSFPKNTLVSINRFFFGLSAIVFFLFSLILEMFIRVICLRGQKGRAARQELSALHSPGEVLSGGGGGAHAVVEFAHVFL